MNATNGVSEVRANTANETAEGNSGNMPDSKDPNLQKLMEMLRSFLAEASKTFGNSANGPDGAEVKEEVEESEDGTSYSKTVTYRSGGDVEKKDEDAEADGNEANKANEEVEGNKTNNAEKKEKGNSANKADKKEDGKDAEKADEKEDGGKADKKGAEPTAKSAKSDAGKAEETGKADETESKDAKDADSGFDVDGFLSEMRDILEDDSLSDEERLMKIIELMMSFLAGGKDGNKANEKEDGNKPNKADETEAEEGNKANAPEKGNKANEKEDGKGKGKSKGADSKEELTPEKLDSFADQLCALSADADPAEAAVLSQVIAAMRDAIATGQLDDKTLEAYGEALGEIAEATEDDELAAELKKLQEELDGFTVDAQKAAGKDTDDTKGNDANMSASELETFFKDLVGAMDELAEAAPNQELADAIREATKVLEDALKDDTTPDADVIDEMIAILSEVDSAEAEAVVGLLKDAQSVL